jgi:hypothetical protein
MPLSDENVEFVTWMDTYRTNYDTENGQWGYVLSSTFLQSCALVTTSEAKPWYENLNLQAQLDSLYRGDISCSSLEKLVLCAQRLGSLDVLNDRRLYPALINHTNTRCKKTTFIRSLL